MTASRKNRFLVRLALFSAIWSILESTLGLIFKGMRLPLGGAVMGGLAMTLILTSRASIPHRGAILALGGITAVIKFISTGVFMPGPTLAILVESVLAEIIIDLLGYKTWSIRLASILGVLYTTVHPFITQRILFGLNAIELYRSLFEKMAGFMQMSHAPIIFIATLYALLHLIIGWISGEIIIRLSRQLLEADSQIHQ